MTLWVFDYLTKKCMFLVQSLKWHQEKQLSVPLPQARNISLLEIEVVATYVLASHWTQWLKLQADAGFLTPSRLYFGAYLNINYKPFHLHSHILEKWARFGVEETHPNTYSHLTEGRKRGH